MKKITLVVVLFAALCLVQWVVPASMILKRETALRKGEVYKFKTAPVDPYDAFRGRYVALNYEQNRIEGRWSCDEFVRGRVAYAVLGADEDGFAIVEDVRLDRPAERPYLAVRIGYIHNGGMGLSLPFDRYYMDEFAAPEAERLFFRRVGERQQLPSYVRVRIHKGFGVIEELMIEETPILEWLAAQGDETR